MHTKAQLKSYEDLEFAITITAPVEDWRAMLKRLEGLKDGGSYAWPVGGFVGCIRSMVENLDKTHADSIRKEDQASSGQ